MREMLSKKHYKALAALIGQSQDLKDFTDNLKSYLQSDNYRFNGNRFDAAAKAAKGGE